MLTPHEYDVLVAELEEKILRDARDTETRHLEYVRQGHYLELRMLHAHFSAEKHASYVEGMNLVLKRTADEYGAAYAPLKPVLTFDALLEESYRISSF